MKSLSDLKAGEKAKVTGFTIDKLACHFIEMGFLPGEYVTLNKIAPLGDPISISLSGCFLSIRKSDAASILVEDATE